MSDYQMTSEHLLSVSVYVLTHTKSSGMRFFLLGKWGERGTRNCGNRHSQPSRLYMFSFSLFVVKGLVTSQLYFLFLYFVICKDQLAPSPPSLPPSSYPLPFPACKQIRPCSMFGIDSILIKLCRGTVGENTSQKLYISFTYRTNNMITYCNL